MMQTPAGMLAAARRAQIRQARAANGGVKVTTHRPYFSIVRASATRSGSSPNFTFTLVPGIIARAFGFQIGQDMAVGGRPSTTATKADTNLYQANQTIDSEVVDIRGIKVQLASGGAQSDPAFLAFGARDISVSMQFNGSQKTYDLGNLEMIPGGTGIYTGSAAASTSTGSTVGSVTLGTPSWLNHFQIPEGITWNPASNADSSLNVIFTCERTISWVVNNATAPATAVMDLRVELVSRQDAQRSTNA